MDIEINFTGNKKIDAVINGYTVKTDQRKEAGGDAEVPTSFELFLASLATCSGFYVKSFCDQRNIPSEQIRMFMHVERNPDNHSIEKIGIEIVLPPDFPEKYKSAVIKAADSCSVKKIILSPPEFEVFSSSF
ncbi:MAG: OsmC family protein [Bacteroidota bacterium]